MPMSRALWVPLTLALLSAALAAPATAADPELLSGPYTIAPRTDGATVCWQTTLPSDGALRYRPAGGGTWRTAQGRRTCFHAVPVTGLPPATDCEVRVLDGASELASLGFRTAPQRLDAFTFFVYGDTRSNPPAHGMVATALAEETQRRKQPTFVLMTGDLAMFGSDERETAEQFFEPAAPVLRTMPLLPIRGNHECGTELFKKYFPAPARPPAAKDADDYVVDYGSVRVVVLDQYAPARSSGPRMKWLADRLAEAGEQWRIVGFHEPAYSSGAHGENRQWRKLVEPLLQRGRVHAVFCGHDHDYERIKPQYGVTHFVTGGGGAPLRDITAAPYDYSAKLEPVHHFLTVEVTPGKLIVQARCLSPRTETFEVFDSVEIPRDCGWATARATPESGPPTGGDRGVREVLYGYDPRRQALKKWLLVGGLALLALALFLKALKMARRESGGGQAAD
jgi:hypothetical protein